MNINDFRHPLIFNDFLYLRDIETGIENCFEIEEEQGRGASCIVYKAYVCSDGKRQRPILLKEFYPVSFSSKLERDSKTHALIFNQHDSENHTHIFQAYVKEKKYFLKASERQQETYLKYNNSTDELVEIQGVYSLGASYYVLMKAASGCSWDKIKLHEESLYEILETGLSVLQELSIYHQDNTLHCDIKPANIYIFRKTRQHVILLDLGSSQLLNNDGTLTGRETLSYTELYAAPELIDTKDKEGIDRIDYYSCVTFKADLYSVAAVLYSRITGLQPPVETHDIEPSLSGLFSKEKNNWLKNITHRVIKELSSFFEVMLARDFDLRYDLNEMKRQLRRIMLHARTSGLSLHEQYRAIYPSEYFTGRTSELKALKQFLSQSGNMIFIHGDGGIGKSELALKLAWDERESYDFYYTVFNKDLNYTIMTLRTEPPLSVNQEITASPEELYAYNLRCLRGYGSTTILIIDNFDYPPEDEDKIFHSQEYSDLASLEMKIIFTSRHRPSHVASSLKIQEMNLPELMNLMCSIYKNNSDKAVLEKLIAAAQNNTLIIEQIARTLEQSWGAITPENMLHLLENSTSGPSQYNELIYRHIKTLFNLSVLGNYSKKIMARSILFPAGGINAVIFLECHDEILKDKIRLLELNGWLKKTADNNIMVHSLVKETCRRELQNIEEDCAEFIENYYTEFSKLPLNEYMTQRFQRVEIASNAATKLKDIAGVYSEKAGDLNFQEGLYRHALQFYNSYWEKYLAANPHPEPRSAMKIMDKVASTEYKMCRYEDAIYHEKFGLCIAEKEIGGGKPDFVPEFFPYYLNLGNIYLVAGDYQNAMNSLDTAEAMYEKQNEENYTDKAAIYINKARLFARLRNFETAVKYGNKAMKILDGNRDISKDWLASLLELFGSIDNELGLYKNAINYFEQAISIYEALLGKEHPRTAISYNNKAIALINLREYDEAISILLPAIETLKSTVGMNHSYTSKICQSLAFAYAHNKHIDQALMYCEQAIEINKKLFGFPVEAYPKLHKLYKTLTQKVDDMNSEKKI